MTKESTDQEIIEHLNNRIAELIDTNRKLNRRANGIDSIWQSRAMKAESLLEMYQKQHTQTFDRMLNAFQELKEIYELIRKAQSLPKGRYHSVSDMPFVPTEKCNNAHVYANVYISSPSPMGGIKTERVVDAVRNHLFPTKEDSS